MSVKGDRERQVYYNMTYKKCPITNGSDTRMLKKRFVELCGKYQSSNTFCKGKCKGKFKPKNLTFIEI